MNSLQLMITVPNGLSANMRWRLAITALVAALLGGAVTLMAQFFAETQNASIFVPANFPPVPVDGFDAGSGTLPYDWKYHAAGRTLNAPYEWDLRPIYPPDLSKSEIFFQPAETQKARWNILWYQLLFLDWLQQKGTRAGEIAVSTAFFAAWSVFALDRVRRRTKGRQPGQEC